MQRFSITDVLVRRYECDESDRGELLSQSRAQVGKTVWVTPADLLEDEEIVAGLFGVSACARFIDGRDGTMPFFVEVLFRRADVPFGWQQRLTDLERELHARNGGE